MLPAEHTKNFDSLYLLIKNSKNSGKQKDPSEALITTK
jgi:hypothetical protein